MATHTVSTTTNFVVQYVDDSSNSTQPKAMADAIASVCENEFTVITGWFAITSGFGTGDRITVTVQSISAGGANNYGYQSGGSSTINVNYLPGGFSDTQAASIAQMMFINELVEIFMDFNNKLTGTTTWVAGHSDGEGLSQLCGILRFPTGHYLAYGSWANQWLSTSRTNWVSTNESTDGNAVSFGCSLLFLFYLQDQLGFTVQQIVQNGAPTLAGLYTNLTGDSSDPFNFFLQLVNVVAPGTSTLGGSGQTSDDPFPTITLSFWDDKNTFGKAEVQDAVNHGRPFNDAFLLVLEGFSPSHWQALGSPVPAPPSGPAAGFAGISFTRTHVEFENAATPLAPQRIHFYYDVGFNSSSPGAFTAAPQVLELDSSITVSSVSANATTDFEFFGAEDPYFSNIKAGVDNVPWLSQDLRVFTAVPNIAPVPVPGGPTFGTDSLSGARGYLKALLGYLNQHFGDPSLTDPFDSASNVIPQQSDALSGDSSVIPNFAFLGSTGDTYNFAISRVRLRGPIGTVSKPVKVFFRMWQSQSPDTNYNLNTTYKSHLDAANLPDWPLPAPDSSTFPFFATGNTPDFTNASNPEFGNNGVNNQPITINFDQGQWTYFGCLLNVYDSSYQVNSTPVTQLLPGTHHCLVAQIAYDDAPILNTNGVTVSPGNTDKLAQRNLQITPAFNPGNPPTNRVPQTFDIRPSAAAGSGSIDFDELMIDWGNTPAGSIASIYWPQASASQILQLASRRYGYHELTSSDARTIQCKVVNGLTYVPIPPGAVKNFAGLLTVDLPQTVKKGQKFTVIVRRVTTYQAPPPDVPEVIKSPALRSPEVKYRKPETKVQIADKHRPAKAAGPRAWRYISGAFQVDIPVKADAEILPYDENTLAIFKWRLQVMSPTNRWYPVILRYIEYLSARVDGMGGDAGSIVASATGLPHAVGKPSEGAGEFTGKVCEIYYDCFGEFEGFILRSCSGEHSFHTRERGIEDVVLRARRDRITLSVFVSKQSKRISQIVMRCCSA